MQYFSTESSITLYWEKTDNLPSDYSYRIYANEKQIAETKKTHITLNNLEENTRYFVQVQVWNKDVLFESYETMQIWTTAKKRILDVSKAPYNAVGDGMTLNTKILQQAINDCGIKDVVYIPAGVYLTGALKLHSDMEIYIEKDGVLQGTDVPTDYLPRIHSRFEGIEMECYSSLLNLGELDSKAGYTSGNVVIHGEGTIASGGRNLAENIIESEKMLLKEYMDSLGDCLQEYECLDTIPGRVRPRLINISNAKDVRISGLTLKNGASWNVHMIYSKDIVTNHCTFYSEDVWNGDGWDPDSSTDCTIFDCKFYTGDDSIAIKSGKNPEGNIINRPSEHIRIFDCVSYFGHGITIGSEMSGGIKDIKIWDCDFGKSMYGLEIKGTKKRGGYVKNIHMQDCTVPRIMLHSVGYNDDGISAGAAPEFLDCVFENIEITGSYLDADNISRPCQAIELCGFDEEGHEIKNIAFRNIHINTKEDMPAIFSVCRCEGLSFENIRHTVKKTSDNIEK